MKAMSRLTLEISLRNRESVFLMSCAHPALPAGTSSARAVAVPGRLNDLRLPTAISGTPAGSRAIAMADGADGVTLVLKKCQRLLVALVPLALASTLASAQPAEVLRNEITLRGTVDAVDHATRTVSIRGEQGNVVTLDVPQSVARFDQVKVGDIVTASYFDVVSVRPKPAGEAAVDRTLPPITTPTQGTLPGAVKTSQRMTTVTITSWDPATRVVAFTAPSGTSYTRHLLETDVSLMAGLKVGDRADVTRTESASFTFRAPTVVQATSPAAAPPPDDLRHRLTVSALFGVDNSFSGKMIKAATGTTTGGAPINLNETNFDDVYGRMGMLRLGVGYRTTPRTEGVLNLIISRSSAQTVNIGTVSTTPLTVDFTDYNYWGVEAGQRVFFARTRFTPYVGYLVGLNRYGDIRGTFVGVPPAQTPGLAAQDGKFFEKSWAFSLGPTGGFLIGVGPFEVMAELQLRFMGGLSDVDWLVEEGLRDINSESSRWSIPVTVGARIRF